MRSGNPLEGITGRVVTTALLSAALLLVFLVTSSPVHAETYAFVTSFGSAGSGNGQFSFPWGVETDPAGNIYVADNGNRSVLKFSSTNTFLIQWGGPFGCVDDYGFGSPTGIAADAFGNVFVADRSCNRIKKFTSSGTFLTKWGSFGSGNGQFIEPFDVAVDSLGNVYVADPGNSRVQKFSSNGAFILSWSLSGFGELDNVGVDPFDQVYVSHTGFGVRVYTTSGTFVRQVGSSGFGSAPGQFNSQRGVDFDSAGNVFVADRNNARVQKFSTTGAFITAFGTGSNPIELAVGPSGKVYVTDVSNPVVKIFALAPSNTAPVANNDAYSTNEDTTLNVAAPGVLGNDNDVDGNALTAVLVSNPANGSLTLNANGSFSYTPNANFNGTNSFTYMANDGTANSNVATVTITVSAVNDAPVANADAYSTNEDTALNVAAPGVLANDTDVDGNALTAVLVSLPANGILTLNANGSFSYTPNANFNGTDAFTYNANDGTSNSNVATVTITVNAVNDAPVANADAYSTNEDTALNVAAPGVLGNDTDTDGNTLTAVAVSNPANGTLTLNANGSFSYTPNANFNGINSFTYMANDGTANSNVATVTITVNAVNEPPSTPDLAAASDSGASNSDNITNDNTPTLTGTCETGSTVELFNGLNPLGTILCSAGAYSFNAGALADGAYAISAAQTDLAGSTSANSAALSVTIDTMPPPTPSTPDLAAASDRGASSTDNITNDNTPTFEGTAEASATVSLQGSFLGAASVDLSGTWTITTDALAEGSYNVTASATDVAGNTSASSAALPVTIDTTAPAAPTTPDLAAASDSGTSNTDNITNDNTPTFTGTAQGGATVRLFQFGSQLLGEGVANSLGNWTVTSSVLFNGLHNMTATATDPAGNTSVASGTLAVTIDTIVSAPIPDLVASSDTGGPGSFGFSNTDNVTRDNTPTFAGATEAGASLEFFAGALQIGTVVASSVGSWTVTSPVLADGVYSFSTRVTDIAGNISGFSSGLIVTIDTVPPAARLTSLVYTLLQPGPGHVTVTDSSAPFAMAAVPCTATLTGLVSDDRSGINTAFLQGLSLGIARGSTNGVGTVTSCVLPNSRGGVVFSLADVAGNFDNPATPVTLSFDLDGDGMNNITDNGPLTAMGRSTIFPFSTLAPNAFDDTYLFVGGTTPAGITVGTVDRLAPSVASFRMEDKPNDSLTSRNEGVRVMANGKATADPSGGAPVGGQIILAGSNAVIKFLNTSTLFNAQVDFEVTEIGSEYIEVTEGQVEIELPDIGTVLQLDAGDAVEIEDTSATDVVVTVVAGTVSGTINDQVFEVAQGQTVHVFDFSLSASPASRTVAQGQSTSYNVDVELVTGSGQPVALSVAGLPAGVTSSFTSASVTPSGNSTLFLTTSPTTPSGTYTLTVTGAGDVVTKSTTVDLVVLPVQEQTFFSDSQFQAITDIGTVFTPDKATGTLKLTATNPGTYFFNKTLKNTGATGITTTITVTIPASVSPPGPSLAQAFCLKGSMPVHVYADMARTVDLTAQATIAPSQPIGVATSTSLTCMANLTITLTIPAGELRYITAHLDFNAKGSTGFAGDAAITYRQGFRFVDTLSVSGFAGMAQDTATFTAVGKRVSANGGFALDTNLNYKSTLRIRDMTGAANLI